MSNAVKYSFNMTPEVMNTQPLKTHHDYDKLFIALDGVKNIDEVVKISANYMFEFVNESEKQRVKIINEILEETKKRGMASLIPTITKGLLFFEESSENFKEIIVEHFVADNEKETISELMNEMEDLQKNNEGLDKEMIRRRSEIQEVLFDYQETINGKIFDALSVNFNLQHFGNQIH